MLPRMPALTQAPLRAPQDDPPHDTGPRPPPSAPPQLEAGAAHARPTALAPRPLSQGRRAPALPSSLAAPPAARHVAAGPALKAWHARRTKHCRTKNWHRAILALTPATLFPARAAPRLWRLQLAAPRSKPGPLPARASARRSGAALAGTEAGPVWHASNAWPCARARLAAAQSAANPSQRPALTASPIHARPRTRPLAARPPCAPSHAPLFAREPLIRARTPPAAPPRRV